MEITAYNPDQTTYFEDVTRFHRKFGLPCTPKSVLDFDPKTPRFAGEPDPHTLLYRYSFLVEELEEAMKAVVANDLATYADSLVDYVYVLCGTALYFDYNLDHSLGGVNAGRSYQRIVRELRPDERDHYVKTGYLPRGMSVPDPRFSSRIFSQLFGVQAQLFTQLSRPVDRINTSWACEMFGDLMVSTLRLALSSSLPFDRLWDDVQRANMSKARAESAEAAQAATGRKSAFDVIKPPGWIGPRTQEILDGWYEANNITAETAGGLASNEE